MSESNAKEIKCRGCNKKVPLGKFCINCGNSLNTKPSTRQRESTDGAGDGSRLSIQVSEASSSSSSGAGTKPSSDASVVSLTLDSPGSYQSNAEVPDSTVTSSVTSISTTTTTTTTTTLTSSYTDVLESPQQNVPQNQLPTSLVSDVTTNSDPQSQDSRHRSTREGSRTANGAPGLAPGKLENGGHSFCEKMEIQNLDDIRNSPALLHEMPKIETLMEFTSCFIDNWKNIAVDLELKPVNISNIALQDSPENCYRSMLEHWLLNDTDATWKKYIKILDELPPLQSENTTLYDKEQAEKNLGVNEVTSVSSRDKQSQSEDVEALMCVNDQTSAVSREERRFYQNHYKETNSSHSIIEENHNVAAEAIPLIYITSKLRNKLIKIEMESGDKISQLKNQIILRNQMLEPRIANQLIIELRDHTMYYILEDDDLVDKIEEKKPSLVTIKEVHEFKNQDKAAVIVKQVGIYFENRVKDKWKTTKHKSKIKFISAMIKENTTDFSENRFQIISFATGTACQSRCSNKEKYFDICDGHAASLCYYGAQIYFQTQLKKIIDSGESSPLFYSTNSGYAVKPYYQFHLFISKPPCGFMRDDKKYLVSWKIPFEKQPHVPECSSRILINSYLGIQGPLTIMFAQPVYIADVIILKCDELISTNCKQTDFAVFDDTKAVETKLENLSKTLQATNRFHFNKPEILVHAIDRTELNKHFDQTVCSFALDETESQTCSVSVPIDTGDEGQYVITATKEKDKLWSKKGENKRIQNLWKLMRTEILSDHELFPFSQVCCCFRETQEAMKTLCKTLKMNIAIKKAKEELENKIKTCEEVMEEDFECLKADFETLCLKEQNYENTKVQEESMIKKFYGIPDKLLEKKDNVVMVKFLDSLDDSNAELLDCTWNKYCSIMQIAVQERATKEPPIVDATDNPDQSSSTIPGFKVPQLQSTVSTPLFSSAGTNHTATSSTKTELDQTAPDLAGITINMQNVNLKVQGGINIYQSKQPHLGMHQNTGAGIGVPGVSNSSTEDDCDRLLWQVLNKKFGNAKKSIFVMAIGHQPSSFEFSIIHDHAKLAGQKAFELVNNALHCGTNYSPTGSLVSNLWESFLNKAKPRTGYEDQLTFENDRNDMKKELKKNARDVVNYEEYPLEYYNVSLDPANWYQWFDSQYEDRTSWMQIDVDSKSSKLNDGQADLYRELGGFVPTSEKHSNVKISLKVRAVEIIRPWLEPSILYNENYTIHGEKPGSWSTGELSDKNDGRFALLSTRMIVAKDLKVTGSTETFSVGSNSNHKNNTIIIGYVCTLLPKFPH